MSEPTYRIDTEHDPTEGEYVRWEARVTRLSDDRILKRCYGKTEADAISQAGDYIDLLDEEPKPGRTLYVTTNGEIVPAPEPQSLRVAP